MNFHASAATAACEGSAALGIVFFDLLQDIHGTRANGPLA